MADLVKQDFHQTDIPVDQPEQGAPETDVAAEIGLHVGFDWTPEPMYLTEQVLTFDGFDDDTRDISPLSEDARKTLLDLDNIHAKSDVAPRRIEIEQAWKADHYDRGYQFLLHHRNGGWTMPGAGTGFDSQSQRQFSTLYHTNVYGEKGEIIVAALAREVPRVQFFPANPEFPPDQDMAEVATDLKDIWAKNNNLQGLLQDAAKVFWTEDRCLFWTRFELNGDEYGYEEEEEPVVPEDEQNPPPSPLDTEAGIQEQEENKSPVNEAAPRRPRGRVRTTALGKLDHKVPIYVDSQFQMGVLSVSEDKDISTVKAQFLWMKDKVRGGGDGTGETELDRIARENVRQAVPGQYVTGDSLNRHCVVKHTWLRRSMFFDVSVKEDVRKELLAKFPAGCVLVKAATEFAYARNECMDDHITVGHPFPGKGQNRRALGESLLPIQDYINEMIALTLDFAKRTVAKKWMDADAFNIESIRTQKNIPGDIGPFRSQPGKSVDQLIFIEPTPTPQPYLVTWTQWLISSLSEQISGALPSLFGAQISGQVGSEGVAIQRDQALQRVGCPWNSLQAMFSQAARQAAMLTARCANKDINDVIPGKGRVSIKLNNLKGNVLCYPEANPELPESWSQRETRVMSIVDKALASPSSEMGQMILSPKNLKAIKSAIRMPDFVIKGAASVEKQEAELEILLRSAPQPNPQKAKMQQALAAAAQGMAALKQKSDQGLPPTPEESQQVQQAPQMMQQLQQQMAGLPEMISTVPVRADGSEDDAIEASILFDWMNSASGRKFEYGTPEQKGGFANVHLHWQEHTDADKKLHPPPPPPTKPPSVSIAADKMPPEVQSEIVQSAGLAVPPGVFEEHSQTTFNKKVAERVIPDQVYLSGLHKEG